MKRRVTRVKSEQNNKINYYNQIDDKNNDSHKNDDK